MGTLHLSDAARTASTAAIVGLVDAGPSAGTLKVYTGSIPATPATSPSGTLLATITLVDPAYGAPTTGVSALADPGSVTAVATGTAGWCRVADSTGAVVFDGDVTATGGGGVLELASTAITSGAAVDVTGGSFTTAM